LILAQFPAGKEFLHCLALAFSLALLRHAIGEGRDDPELPDQQRIFSRCKVKETTTGLTRPVVRQLPPNFFPLPCQRAKVI